MRQVLLRSQIGALINEGVDDFIFESRGSSRDSRGKSLDDYDRMTMLDVLREMGRAGTVAYRWEKKAEPLLWLADAVCGAVREHLTQTDDQWIQRLEAGADVRIHWHQGP